MISQIVFDKNSLRKLAQAPKVNIWRRRLISKKQAVSKQCDLQQCGQSAVVILVHLQKIH